MFVPYDSPVIALVFVDKHNFTNCASYKVTSTPSFVKDVKMKHIYNDRNPIIPKNQILYFNPHGVCDISLPCNMIVNDINHFYTVSAINNMNVTVNSIIINSIISNNENISYGSALAGGQYTPCPLTLQTYVTAHGLSYYSYLKKEYKLSVFNIDNLYEEALNRQLIQFNKSPCVKILNCDGDIVIAGQQKDQYSFTKDGYAMYGYLQEKRLIPLQMPMDKSVYVKNIVKITQCDLIVIRPESGTPAI